MSKSNKRTLTDIEANQFPSIKRARTQHAAPLPPAPESAPRTPSSLTLIASTPSFQSVPSSKTSATGSVTNAPTTSSSELSSTDYSSSDSDTRSVPSHFIPYYPIPHSPSTSSTATTSSPSSTSASITDDGPCSTCSLTNNQDPSSSSPTDSLSPSTSSPTNSDSLSASASERDTTPSPTIHATSRTLTTKNLATLQQRLNSLLPRLQSANELLEVERREGRLGERDIQNVHNEVEDGYIALELGLGVLEKKLKRGAGAVKMERGGSGSGSVSSGEGWDMVMDGKMAIGKVMRRMGGGAKRKVKIEDVGGR